MEDNRSVIKGTLGMCLVCLGVLGGPLAVYGLYLVVGGLTSDGNLAGLLVIFGLPICIVGIILVCALVPSFLLMKRNLEDPSYKLTSREIRSLVLLVVIPALCTVLFLAKQRLDRMVYEKLTQDFDIYEPTKEMIRSMKERIKNEFRKHKTLFLTVRYFPPQSDDLADQESLKDYYVEAIGRENIRNFKWGLKNDFFVVELTETGYGNLRKTKYLRPIYFYDMATYGKHDGFR